LYDLFRYNHLCKRFTIGTTEKIRHIFRDLLCEINACGDFKRAMLPIIVSGTSQHHHTMHPAMQHYMYHTGVGVAGGLHQGFAPPAPPPIHPHSHSHSHSHHMTSLQGLQLAATTNAMVSARLLPSSAIDQRLRPPIIDQDLPRRVCRFSSSEPSLTCCSYLARNDITASFR